MPDTDHTERSPRPHARFHVHADRVLAWLATAVDAEGEPLADAYGIDDSFRLGGDDMHERIKTLVTVAYDAGILTASGHRLELWRVGDEGFLLTVDPPSPPRLCSQRLLVRDLLPAKTSGSVAAFAVLLAVGQVANQLLDEQTRAHASARGRAPTAFLGGPPAAIRTLAQPPTSGRQHPPARGSRR